MLRTLHKWYGLMLERRDVLVAAVKAPVRSLVLRSLFLLRFRAKPRAEALPISLRSLFAGSRDSSYGRSRNRPRIKPPAGGKVISRDLAPALVGADLRVDRISRPETGLSVTSETPVSKKDLLRSASAFTAVGKLLDRLDAERGHKQRILRGGADHAFLD